MNKSQKEKIKALGKRLNEIAQLEEQTFETFINHSKSNIVHLKIKTAVPKDDLKKELNSTIVDISEHYNHKTFGISLTESNGADLLGTKFILLMIT